MRIIPVKTKRITENQNIFEIIFAILKKYKLKNGDVVCFSSKIISLAEKRSINLKDVRPSLQAKKLAKKYSLSPAFCQLVMNESDNILGGVKKAILTIKNHVVIANAGIDQSNVPINKAILWPKNPSNTAQSLKNALILRFKKQLGVILIDSQCFPLRRGTRGFALAIAGFGGIIDERGKKDLFGKKMRITTVNIADQLAAAASGIMGERNQKVPVVIIRNAPIKLSKKNAKILNKELLMNPRACLFKDYGLK